MEGVRCGGMMSIDSSHVYLEVAKKDNMYHTIVYATNPRVNKMAMEHWGVKCTKNWDLSR